MSKCILIIEDNATIRQSTAEILELSGYNVMQAADGKNGVARALQQIPDLILCDIMMPELDGYGVLYLLSKNPETAAIPFIFLTAKAESVDLRRGMEMGADDYLTKPMDGIDLLNAVDTRLRKSERQQAFFNRSLQKIEDLFGANTGNQELKALITSRKIRQIKKKQVLYYEGDEPLGIYLVMDGSIKTIKLDENGRELMIGLYRADGYFGISAVLLDEPFSETAEALEDSAVCLLPKDMIMPLIDRYPELGRRFLKILSNDIKEKEEHLVELAFHSVRKRVAQALVKLSNQATDPLKLKISRDELASMVCIANETLSRTLTDFKKEELIEKKGANILLLDIGRLMKMKN